MFSLLIAYAAVKKGRVLKGWNCLYTRAVLYSKLNNSLCSLTAHRNKGYSWSLVSVVLLSNTLLM